METTSPTRTARKPLGINPATDIESWDAVPWFRRSWILVLVPAVVVVALTGDVFTRATKRMKEYSEADVWRYTIGSRAFFALVSLTFTVVVAASFLG